MNIAKGCIFLLLGASLSLGCVSHTERVPHRSYLTQQDEGLWAEVKREFGWQSSRKTNKQRKGQASFYTRMLRSVTGWFTDNERPVGPDLHPRQWERLHQEYEREQKKLGLY